jgi:putative DNA primase/helicase
MRGIFTWLVAGLFKYKRFGLYMPEALRAPVREYERDNDLVVQFLEEKCEKDPDGSAKAKSLYDTYKMWCKSNGYYVCSSKKFNAEVTAHPEWCDGKEVSHGLTVFRGLKLT